MRRAVIALPGPWRSIRLRCRAACCSACVARCRLSPACWNMQFRHDVCSEIRITGSTQEARPTHVDVRDVAALVNHRMPRCWHAARMLGDRYEDGPAAHAVIQGPDKAIKAFPNTLATYQGPLPRPTPFGASMHFEVSAKRPVTRRDKVRYGPGDPLGKARNAASARHRALV